MTTSSWSSTVSVVDTAAFRTTGLEISNKFAEIGLVKTSDTGQIDWATVNKAASNNYAGYEIWRFNDSLQSTAPIFFKIEYGTVATNSLGVRVTISTGTNGAGGLTGLVGTAITCHYSATPNTSNSYPSYFCHTEGFLGVVFKMRSLGTTYPIFSFAISRTCNPDGSPNGVGCIGLFFTYQQPAVQCINFSTNYVNYTTSAESCSIPQSITSSAIGADQQVFLNWFALPKVQPCFSLATVIKSEFTEATTFQTALIGTTLRTFISVDLGLGKGASNSANNYGYAMIWE